MSSVKVKINENVKVTGDFGVGVVDLQLAMRHFVPSLLSVVKNKAFLDYNDEMK